MSDAVAPHREFRSSQVPCLLQAQREYFATGVTRTLDFRLGQIRKLAEILRSHEKEVYAALRADLRKPAMEAYLGELGVVLEEAKFAAKHLKSWSRPRRVSLSLAHWPASGTVTREPYGVALIVGPWNYPLQLTLSPLVGAMAAGDCAVVKPSELAPQTSALLQRLVSEHFAPEYVAVVEGGVETTRALLAERWDYIFFTGSTRVGKIVMEATAKHLTPLTLELGGKSPCIVEESAVLEIAARRIVWGKFFNAGQTCVAPDYLLVQRSVRDQLIEAMKRVLKQFYGEDPQRSADYARILNLRHFQRLTSYLGQGKILVGGKTDPQDLYIEPTLLEQVPPEAPVMQEEIFGPVFPVLDFDRVEALAPLLKLHPKPLAFYLFTQNAEVESKVLRESAFGGGCVNDTIAHLAAPQLPYGGVGPSGFGSYHGKKSFETFSYPRGVLKRSTRIDMPVRYPPYDNPMKLKIVKKLIG